jgi:hypothetical protein
MYKTEDDTELLFQRLIKPDGTGEYAPPKPPDVPDFASHRTA